MKARRGSVKPLRPKKMKRSACSEVDPYAAENKYYREVMKLKRTIPNWEDMYCPAADDSRVEQLIRVEVIGHQLCRKYSWAIPDNRAIKILSHFSPLVEIGCGKGYWAHLLRKLDVDIICYDKILPDKSWTEVLKGGAEVVAEKSDRTLFLCYPDEAESMAIKCLEQYSGMYVIHVGELAVALGGGATSGYSSPQAPWGRTTSAEFQVALAEEFHCLLVAEIPRFPFSRDCISVWKRTRWVEGKDGAVESEEDSGAGVDDDDDEEEEVLEGEGEGEGEDENGMDSRELNQSRGDELREVEEDTLWAAIPMEERLPMCIAAPILQHLLE